MLNDKTGTQWAVEIQEIQPSFLKKNTTRAKRRGGGFMDVLIKVLRESRIYSTDR